MEEYYYLGVMVLVVKKVEEGKKHSSRVNVESPKRGGVYFVGGGVYR